MSRNTLEKVLYDLSTSGANKKKFAEDPEKYLSRYQLAEDERALVLNYKVRELADLGVNTMLTWGFWLQAGKSNRDYLKIMKREEA
jgi:protocatechuate 4,5-dioxygenase alpha chain